MTLETYVIGSILLGVIVVAVVAMVHLPADPYPYPDPHPNPFDEAFKCPRCGAMMQNIGSGVGGCTGIFVVQEILVLKCPQCGYSERSWA